MEQRVSLITLGVSDLERSRTFYERLGWRGQTVQDTVFFQAGGLVLALWGRDELLADAGLPRGSEGGSGMALAYNVRARSDVDAVVTAAEAAGAQVTRRPADTSYGGYAGYFRDPDGHLWEAAWNPGFPIGEDGSVTLPDFGAAHQGGLSR